MIVLRVYLLILAVMAGCRSVPAPPSRAPASQTAAGCDRAASLERARTAEAAVLAIACRPVSARAYQQVYRRFDEHRADQFHAGVVLASCHRAGACWYSGGDRGEVLPFLPGAAATRHELAMRLDLDAVTARVLSLRVSPQVKQLFVTRVRAARAHLLEVVPRLDIRWKRVYIAPVQRARQRWRAAGFHLAELDEAWRQLRTEVAAALADDTFNLSHRLRVEALRERYLAACHELDDTTLACLGRPIPREATALIANVADALGDPLTAQLERTMLRQVPDRSRLPYDIHAAVATAMAEERARYAAYREARKRAADPTTLRERFGDPPPLDLARQPNGAGVAPPRAAAAAAPGGAVRSHRQVVQTIERSTDSATLVLGAPKSRRRGRVRVPRADAEAIQRGEVVEILYHRDPSAGIAAGRVLRVFARERGAELRQLGPYRL